MTRLYESILDNIGSDDRHPVPQEDIFKEYPDYLFIMANSQYNGSIMKDAKTSQLLEDTMAAFDVQHRVVTMTPDEYRHTDVIDHGADYKFIGMTAVDAVTCIFFDYPDTVRDQVKFIIRMLSVYRNSYWGYSDVYMYWFDSVQYVPMYDHIRGLVAAEHDIAGLGFHLTHSDAKCSFQYESKELEKLKLTVTNALPDNSQETYDSVSRCIDRMLRIRRRRIARYRYCGDETSTDVKWRPVHESVLDDLDRSVLKRDYQEDVCNFLGLHFEEQKFQVEHALKNLLKCPRGVSKSAELYESVLDNLEKTEAGIPLAQEDVRFEDYSMVYVVPIEFYKESKYAVEHILDICERYGINAQVRIWTKQEFYELEQIDLRHKTIFMKGTHILCLFIDRLPDTIRKRVWFIIKFMNILSQEYLYVATIYRFDGNRSKNIRFEYRTEGVNAVRFNCEFLIKIRKCIKEYKMYDMQYKVEFYWEDNEANFQVAEVATLVNTYNKTIYSEVKAELNYIGKLLVEKGLKSAKLHESVLDDLDRTSADSARQLAGSSRGCF